MVVMYCPDGVTNAIGHIKIYSPPPAQQCTNSPRSRDYNSSRPRFAQKFRITIISRFGNSYNLIWCCPRFLDTGSHSCSRRLRGSSYQPNPQNLRNIFSTRSKLTCFLSRVPNFTEQSNLTETCAHLGPSGVPASQKFLSLPQSYCIYPKSISFGLH